FVAKYSSANGICQWCKSFTGSAVAAVDPNTGNVVLTGKISGPTDFGGGSIGPGGVFLACYNTDGVYQWAKCFNDPGYGFNGGDVGTAISVDSTGNVAFAGQLMSTITFNGIAGFASPI